MSSSPSAPPVTDPNVTAGNQQAINNAAGQTSQAGSMVNQSNPYGSLSYSQSGTSANGTPLYTATTNLSPAQQQLLNILQGTQTSAGQQGQSLISGANYGSVSPSTAIGDATSGMVGSAMKQEQAYLQPTFTQQTTQLDTQLRNQGFDPSSPAYQQAMNNLQQSQNQSTSGFLASIQPQMYAQATSSYMLPATLGAALASMGSPTNPNASFVNTPSLNIQPANLVGATANAQQAQQQSYQDQLQQSNAMMSGLFGIPTAMLGGWANAGGMSSALAGLAAL